MTATFKLYRASEATRAASSTVTEAGSLLISDEGDIYVGNGSTVASALVAVSGGGGGSSFFYEVESQGTPAGVDDSALIQAAIDASIAGASIFGPAPVRLRPGVTYRGKLLNPTGAWIQAWGAGIKIPDSGTAHNMFVPTGAWRLEGGDFDGNKGATTQGADNTDGNGVYQTCTSSGWSGTVELINCTFHDFQWGAHHFVNTDATLHDPANAPAAAIYMDRVVTANCAKISQRFTGIANIRQVGCDNHGAGSHGARYFLCRNVDVIDSSMCDNVSGHGLTSLYCKYQNIRGGHYERNGTTSGTNNGITIGGDSTSNVNMPGQFIKISGVTAINNGQHNIIFDASLAGTNALIGLGVNDPIPVWSQITDCTANGAVVGNGIIVNSSQFVHIHNPITDGCGAHGISLATRNTAITGIHHAHGNVQKPLALQGATNWGDHDILCAEDYAANVAGDSLTITGSQAPSRFSQRHYSRRAVTTTDTAKLGETLALDTTGGTFVETLPEIAFAAPNRITLKWIVGAVAPTIALTGSDKVDTAGSTTVPVFSALGQSFTLESDPVTSIWTVVSDIAGGIPIVRSLGIYDASGGNFPPTGGSGPAGVVAKGDGWFISVAGHGFNPNVPSGQVPLAVDDLIFATKDIPANDASHWIIPESKGNRDIDGTLASNSDLLYPTQKAVKTYIDAGLALKAALASPALTGNPTAPTASPGDNDTSIATTAFVTAAAALKANLASPALTGSPTAPTQTTGDNSTKLATTAYADAGLALKAPLASPALTGSPTAPTQTAADNSTKIATTAYADTALALKAPLASPALTGSPTVPTQSAGDNSTKAASTAYVDGAITTATVATITGNNQTGTTYTLVLADQGKVVEGNNASAITFTIPPNSSVAYPVGAVVELFQQGAGQITVAAGAGVTLRSPGGRTKLAGQYSSASLRQRATDEWCLEGDIST